MNIQTFPQRSPSASSPSSPLSRYSGGGLGWGLFVLLLTLGCGSNRPPHTDLTNARLLEATHRTILVEVRRAPTVINQLNLHLGPDAHVFAGKQEISATQIPPGSDLKIYRDSTTHRVVRIDIDHAAPTPANN